MKSLSGPINVIAVFSGFLVAITFYGVYLYSKDSVYYTASAQQNDVRTQKQFQDYDRQSKEADRMQAVQEIQNRRFERLLARWEEHADRQDAILKAQEKQLGIGK